jgi:hypothetical protein
VASRTDRLDWHQAFFSAICFELLDYGDALEFSREHQLNAEPLRLDVLIIHKKREVKITKNIGKIFRRDNIVEYKSPRARFTESDFCRTLGYGYIYAANNKLPITDLSLTIVGTGEPRKVLRHLREIYGWTTQAVGAGIEVVVGAKMPFPIQFIDSEKLPETENVFIRDLRAGLTAENLMRVLDASKRELIAKRRRDAESLMRAYLDLLTRANPRTAKEVRNMKYPTMFEVLEQAGITDGWRDERVIRAEAAAEAAAEAKAAEVAEERQKRLAAERRLKTAERQLKKLQLRFSAV